MFGDLMNSLRLRPLAALAFVTLVMLSTATAHAQNATPANSQQCRNGFCKIFCVDSNAGKLSGRCRYVKIISKQYPIVIFQEKDTSLDILWAEADCLRDRKRYIVGGKKLDWEESPMPNTSGALQMDYLCR